MNSASLKWDSPYCYFKNSQDHLASIKGIPLVAVQPAFAMLWFSPRKLKAFICCQLRNIHSTENPLYTFWKAAGLKVKAEQHWGFFSNLFQVLHSWMLLIIVECETSNIKTYLFSVLVVEGN